MTDKTQSDNDTRQGIFIGIFFFSFIALCIFFHGKTNDQMEEISKRIEAFHAAKAKKAMRLCGHERAECIRNVCYLRGDEGNYLIMRNFEDKPMVCFSDEEINRK